MLPEPSPRPLTLRAGARRARLLADRPRSSSSSASPANPSLDLAFAAVIADVVAPRSAALEEGVALLYP